MLIQSAAPTSVEAAMPFATSHREQDLLCPWVRTKTWQGGSECGKLPNDGSELLVASNICANSRVNLVKRRKLQKNSLIVFPVEAEKDEVSRSVVKGSSRTRFEYDNSVVIALPAPQCIRDFGGSNVRNKELRYDNIRSSASEMGVGCCSTKTEANDIYNSDISGLDLLDEDLSIRELSVSLLKSYGLHVAEGDCSMKNSVSSEISGTRNESSSTQSCKMCGQSDNTLNMLLCDNCDEAFHASCCNPKIKFLPIDNWFCHCCSNLDSKAQENPFLKSPGISWSHGISRFEIRPIALMLKYPEPYKSRVRIGDSFQAEVPDWADQPSKYVILFSSQFNYSITVLEHEFAVFFLFLFLNVGYTCNVV